jgi:hypothetical protein
MKGQMDTEMGKIFVDEDVLAKYAGSAAVECFGVVGMASVNVRDGFVKLLKSLFYCIFAEDKLHLSKAIKQACFFALGLHYLCRR